MQRHSNEQLAYHSGWSLNELNLESENTMAVFHLSKPVSESILKPVSVCLCKCCGRFGFGGVAMATRVTTFLFLLNVSAKTFTLQISDMRRIRETMTALPLASARLSKLWIISLYHLLDGDLCKTKFFSARIFSCISVLNHDFVTYINFTRITA